MSGGRTVGCRLLAATRSIGRGAIFAGGRLGGAQTETSERCQEKHGGGGHGRLGATRPYRLSQKLTPALGAGSPGLQPGKKRLRSTVAGKQCGFEETSKAVVVPKEAVACSARDSPDIVVIPDDKFPQALRCSPNSVHCRLFGRTLADEAYVASNGQKGEHVAFARPTEKLCVLISPNAVRKHPLLWKEMARASMGSNCPVSVLRNSTELAAALAKVLKSCRWVGLSEELQDMKATVETVCHAGVAAIAAAAIVVTTSEFCEGYGFQPGRHAF